MQKRSKKHHYVPQVLQRQFAAKPDYIWFSERGENNSFNQPKLKKIEKVFWKRNYYTVLAGNDLSDVVETTFYKKIDDYWGRVLPKILNGFAQGHTPNFSGESLDSLRKVVMEMAKRTPEFVKDYDDYELGKEHVEEMLKLLSKEEDILLLKADLQSPNRLRAYGRDARVRGTVLPSDKVNKALKGFSVRWAASETKHSFILSSKIVYRIGNGGSNGLRNPEMEMWMPVAPKYALVLVRDKKKQIPFRVVVDSKKIREMNEHAAENSSQIASHSIELLESITGKRAEEY